MFILLYMSIILGVITYFEYQNYKISQRIKKNMESISKNISSIADINDDICEELYGFTESYYAVNFKEENINEKK